jgi:transposase
MGITAATDGAVFHAYLERVLLPERRRVEPDAVLVMDSLSAHKAEPPVRELLAASGLACRHLPRHSPDLNPIEPAWAKVKGLLRKAAARTVDGPHGGRPARRARAGAGHHHRPGRERLLPPRRPRLSQLARGPL